MGTRKGVKRPDVIARNKSKKQRKSVSDSHKDGKRKEAYKKIGEAQAIIMTGKKDENHYGWKGDEVGYHGLHKWVYKKLGSPSKCEDCNLDDKNRKYHWANISQEYKRELTDWKRLCCSCHKLYDLNYKKQLP